MDEITIGDKVYVSSKRAAKITGYAKDYVGQLCREGRVEARLVGRNWYVLESAIREHRFGAKEEEPEEAPVVEEQTPISTWKQPEYVAEAPRYVPEFAPKPQQEASAGIPAIEDMQSAWREWFEGRQQAPEPIEETPEASVPEPEETVVEEQEEEIVLISRISEPAEASAEEEVEIRRSYTSRRVAEQAPVAHPPVSYGTSRMPTRPHRHQPVQKQRGNLVLQSLFVVLALAAVLVSIVGSGNADRILAGTSFENGVQKAIVEFLGGSSTVESIR